MSCLHFEGISPHRAVPHSANFQFAVSKVWWSLSKLTLDEVTTPIQVYFLK